MKASPTSRTLAALRAEGWTCAVVERWNPHARVRQDLWGFCDLLACAAGRGTIAVQACAGSGLAAHRDKLLAEPRLREWLLASKDNRCEVWAWRKLGARGKRKVYEHRIDRAELDDLGAVVFREDVASHAYGRAVGTITAQDDS